MKKPSNLSKEIISFIIYKNKITNSVTNINNKLLLNGVNFWMAQQKDSGETYLMYDQHPNTWDEKAISDHINLLYHEMYIKTGIIGL